MKQKSTIISIQQNNNKEVKNYGLGKEVIVQINSQAIIPIIADKIYKNPMSAIRELYNNEVTACEKALSLKPGLEQKIRIELNTDTRELTIQGFNSLGMDSYTFNKILSVMGNSGNSQEDQKGFFGIGFFSFFKLSERIIIISNSLETKEKFAYICKSALKFEQLGKENYDALKTTGFKIIINIKDEINLDHIDHYIKGITKLSGIKTEYIEDGNEIELEQYNDLEDYFKTHFNSFFEDPLSCNYSLYFEHHSNDDFEVIFYQIENSQGEKPNRLEKCFLLNTPIEFNENIDHYHYSRGYLVNLKSERMFRPTPDRERLEQKSEDDLNSMLSDDSYNMSNFDPDNLLSIPKNLHEWYQLPLRWFYHRIGIDNDHISLHGDFKSLRSKGQWNSRFIYKDLEDNLPINEPLSFGYCKSFRKVKFEQLQDDENKFCVCPKKKTDEYLKLLEKIGFKDIIKHPRKSANGKTRKYVQKMNNNFKYHGCNDTYVNFSASNIIIRADELNEDKSLLRHLDNDDTILFVPPLANCEEAINWNDFYALIKNEITWTNRGLMSIDQILKGIKHRKYTKYTNSKIRIKTLLDESKFIIYFKDRVLQGRLEFYMSKFVDKHWLTNESIDEPYHEEIKAQLKDPLLIRLFEDKFMQYSFDSDDFDLWLDIIKEYQKE